MKESTNRVAGTDFTTSRNITGHEWMTSHEAMSLTMARRVAVLHALEAWTESYSIPTAPALLEMFYQMENEEIG